MHAISSYRGNRPTHTPTKKTNKQTNRTDYNTLRRSFASAQCKQLTGYDYIYVTTSGVVLRGNVF